MTNKLFIRNTSTPTFILEVTFSRKDARKKPLQIIVEPTSGPAYLRTYNEGEWTDNPVA
jgi:hypothetical protein